ncbi:MAG: GGDEF domain-containing protein, partial [Thermodesulfobacteriota bacterium]|nr:GGDEF domain-containing protein [Thermodesulfobacteriota bacterium]
MKTNESYHHILQLINAELNFPSPPAVAVKILNAMQKDDAALSELGEIITTDPALTAKMLKVANSGIFTLNGTITNIKRAMAVLGTTIIKNIALSFVIAAEMSDNGQTGFDFDHFWRRSVTAAVAAELLSKVLQHEDDDIFMTALLQDIGMLVISLTKGAEYNTLFSHVQSYHLDLLNLEKEKYGFDHQQVGYALLMSWQLPDSISEPILYHHQPGQAPEECQKSAKIVYYANQLSEIYNEVGGAEKARLLQQELIEQFNIEETQTAELLDDVATRSNEILETFELDPGELKPYSLLLQEANAELGKLNLSSEQMVMEMKEAKEKAEKLAHELQDANSRLKELVYRDGLTGLYNHRYFQESLANELTRAIRYHSSVSLILFDIDFFKKVNDTHGHPAGDLVLMNIARAVD